MQLFCKSGLSRTAIYSMHETIIRYGYRTNTIGWAGFAATGHAGKATPVSSENASGVIKPRNYLLVQPELTIVGFLFHRDPF